MSFFLSRFFNAVDKEKRNESFSFLFFCRQCALLRILRIYCGHDSSLHCNENVRSTRSMRFRVRRTMRSGKFLPKRKTRLGRADEKGHKRRKDGGSSPTRLRSRLGEILKKSWIRDETSLNNGSSNPKTSPPDKSEGWWRIFVKLATELQNLGLLRHVTDLVIRKMLNAMFVWCLLESPRYYFSNINTYIFKHPALKDDEAL